MKTSSKPSVRKGKGASEAPAGSRKARKPAALREEQIGKDWQAIFNAIHASVMLLDGEGRVVRANKATAALFNRPLDQILGQPCFTVVHETAAPPDMCPLIKMKKTGKREEIEQFLPSKGIWCSVSVDPILDDQGNLTGAVHILQDITDRKRAQAAISEREEQFRDLFENSMDLMCTHDLDGTILSVNPAALRMTGFGLEDLVGRNIREWLKPEFRPLFDGYLEAVMKDGRAEGIMAVRTRHGEKRVWEYKNSLRVEGVESPIVRGFARDITEQWQVQRDLKKSEEKYRQLTETARDFILSFDLMGRVTYANPAALKVGGYTLEEALQMNVSDILPKERLLELIEKLAMRSQGDEDLWIYEMEFINRAGERIFAEMSSSVIKEDQRPVGVLAIGRDITARKRAEEALKQSEEKYRLVIENSYDGIFILQEGLFKFANAIFLEKSGYSAEELSHLNFLDLIHPQQRTLIYERYTRRLQGKDVPDNFECKAVDKSGREFWIQIHAVNVTWETRPAILYFARDITEEKQLAAQLLEAQKMEAIGTLAGGVAHDFNNLLMGIEGYTSLMMLNLENDHPQYGRLKNIEQLVRNGAELTKQLLGFARGGKYEVKTTDVNDLLTRTSDMFGRTRREITIRRECEPGLWKVEADRGQMEQALLNLYLNAWQAMPTGGELHLKTSNVELVEEKVRGYGVRPGRYVRVSVADTGVGMDEVTRGRVFEPFFTTRRMGRGVGLGLAATYGIVKNHGGFIYVDSEKEKGSAFHIFLPVADRILEERPPAVSGVIKGSETILLVDDEKTNLETTAELLKMLGYQVYVAGSGQEAMAIFLEKKNKIDVVVLDMIMPGIGGGEAYDRIRKLDPGVKVLLCSGYSLDGQANEILSRGCDGFIQKPFRVQELSQKIREILE